MQIGFCLQKPLDVIYHKNGVGWVQLLEMKCKISVFPV